MKYLDGECMSANPTARLAYYHAHWTRRTAPLLDELGAVIDHVTAFSANGSDELDNLVTACNKCNTRKSAAPSEQWAKRPRRFVKGKYGEPDVWDGLSEVFVTLARRAVVLSASDRAWLQALTSNSSIAQ